MSDAAPKPIVSAEIAPAEPERVSGRVILTILVSALGYFVDVYDMVLFGVYRVQSVKDLGVPAEEQLNIGMLLMNVQLGGMILGGILWGSLGDKRGRTSVLLGSIAMFASANIANAFVTDVWQYLLARLFAGIGLAGELGVAVTLVSEVMSSKRRSYGASALFGLGLWGAVAASIAGKYLSWRTGYVVGGAMGLVLLALRTGLLESGMFKATAKSAVRRGDVLVLLSNGRWRKFAAIVLVGVPTWFGAIVVAYLPELAKSLDVVGPVTAGDAIMYNYVGCCLGNPCAALLSQWRGNRKRIILIFMLLNAAGMGGALLVHGLTAAQTYALIVLGGFGSGYTALYISTAAESFGTNLRATVTTSVPNFVRGSLVPMTIGLQLLTAHFGLIGGALVLQLAVVCLGLLALTRLQETFGKELDYLET